MTRNATTTVSIFGEPGPDAGTGRCCGLRPYFPGIPSSSRRTTPDKTQQDFTDLFRGRREDSMRRGGDRYAWGAKVIMLRVVDEYGRTTSTPWTT
ncbi:MAG: hypothetical protein ACLTYN_16940 [Dysosmobacter welbionis]